MNISEAAERARLPTKTIRYYEDIRLVEPARRRDNGYRDYADRDVHMLRFLPRARGLGFSVAELQAMRATLVDLAENCHGDDRPDCPIIDDPAEGLSR